MISHTLAVNTLNSIDVVIYTTVFLVPGFVWSAVLSMLVPRRAHPAQIRFLEFLTLSCINHGIWIAPLAWIYMSGFFANHPGSTALLLVIPTLLSPVGLGLLTGYLYQKDWPRRALGRFGFRTVHQIPTAWDYHFSRQLPYWVIVTLEDGSRAYGLYHRNSFAGDDPSERDLYLEAVYTPNPHGEWAPVEDSGGILIKANTIAAIEFKKLTEIKYVR